MKQLPPRLPQPPQNLPAPAEPEPESPRSPHLRLKRLGYLVGGVGGVVLLGLLVRPAPIPVETGPVERGDLRVTVEAEGKTRVRDRFVIAAPVDGRLARINLTEGSPVAQGAVVAHLDPLPLDASVKAALAQLAEWRAQRQGVGTLRPKAETLDQAQRRIQAAEAGQRQAEARVAAAQAALDQARRDRQRAQHLATSGVIAHQEQERAELNEISRAKELETAALGAKAATAELAVAQAALTVLQAEQRDPDYLLRVYDARIASVEAELAKRQDEAARTEMRSPVQGQVLRLLKQSAQFVAAGTPLLEVGDLNHLELVIDVLSSDAIRIRPGDAIAITQTGETGAIAARVQRIEPAAFTKVSALGVEEQRVNIIGDFLQRPGGIGDAYRVEAEIVVWQRPDVLKVPLSALFRCGQAWCVFVVQAGQAQQRPVEIGQRSRLAAEVRRGLQVGDRVILHPSEQIQTGSRVK